MLDQLVSIISLVMILLAAYGLGMVVPLVGLAAVWSRLSPATLNVIRGRGFRFLGLNLHTTSIITGLLIAAVGVLFWTTNGLVTAPSLVPASLQRWLQSYSSLLATPLWDAVAVIGAAVLVILWLVSRRQDSHDDLRHDMPEKS